MSKKAIEKKIPLGAIYDHNINILIGSGASADAFPTLGLKIKYDNSKPYTIETLATKFEQDNKDQYKTLLFMHYYKECIRKIIDHKYENQKEIPKIFGNYETFIKTLLKILNRRERQGVEKSINIFTTNYDGYLEFVSNELLKTNDFIINDGACGFFKRYLEAKNFNTYSYKSGIFDKYKVYTPQLNLIHLHGSIYWDKNDESGGERIIVDYNLQRRIESCVNIDKFSEILNDEKNSFNDLSKLDIKLTKEESSKFWDEYNKLPIVNPTKWKFHETVFEEHYYQMLRFMSYELEKPHSILIAFGFSFADEHILNLVKRSLANPTLRLFICCYNKEEESAMRKKFGSYGNIEYICLEPKLLTFEVFNSDVFLLDEDKNQ